MLGCALYATTSVAQAQMAPPGGGSTTIPGQWNTWYEIVSGKGEGQSNAPGSQFVYDFVKNEYEGQDPGTGAASLGGSGGDGALFLSGTGASVKTKDLAIKIIYKWGPQGYGPYGPGTILAPPDPRLNFLVRDTGYAYASGGNARTFASMDDKSSPEGTTTWATSGGIRLFSFDTKGQSEFSATIPVKVEASADGYATAHFGISSQFDDRSVSLSRAGATGEEHKVENGVPVTYGDTTYSYKYPYPSMDPSQTPEIRTQENWQRIQASFAGNWQSHNQVETLESYGKSYSWSPAGTHWFYRDHSMGSLQLMPLGQLSKNMEGRWEGTSGVGSHTTHSVTYKITDDDGAEATAVYNLNVHEPVEIENKDDWEVYYLTDYANLGGGMVTVGYPNRIGGSYEMSKSDSSGWSVGGSIGGDLEVFAIPFGVDLTGGYEQSHEEGTTEIAPVPTDGSGNDVVLKLGETVHLRVKHKFQRHYVAYSKYSPAGKIKRYSSAQSGLSVEIPHEGIWDVFKDDEFLWTDPYQTDDGMPEIDEDERQLPDKTPSYHYSLKEGKDAQPLA